MYKGIYINKVKIEIKHLKANNHAAFPIDILKWIRRDGRLSVLSQDHIIRR